MLYDPRSEAFESEHKIFGFGSILAIAYVPSLISLKDVAKGEYLKVRVSLFGTSIILNFFTFYFISLVVLWWVKYTRGIEFLEQRK